MNRWGPALGTLLALALGAWNLGARSLWLDESFSWAVARLPLAELVTECASREPNQSLYLFLLHFWLELGHSEGAMRALSVICFAASMPLVWRLGERIDPVRGGLVASVLCLTHPFLLEHAREVRGYSLSLLLALLATELFLTRRWRWYAVVLTAGIWTHLVLIALMPAHAIGALLARKLQSQVATEQDGKPMVLAWGVASALALPLLYASSRVPGDPLGWVASISVTQASELVQALLGANWIAPASWLLLLIFAIKGKLDRDQLILTASALCPIALVVLASVFKPMLIPRFLLFTTPFLILAVVPALRRSVALVPAVALLISNLVALPGAISATPKEDWRAVTAWLIRELRPGESVITYNYFVREPLAYYASRAQPPRLLPIVEIASAPWGRGGGQPDVDPAAVRRAAESERVWFVVSHVRKTGGPRSERVVEIEAGLTRAGLRRTRREGMTGIAVSEWSRLPLD